VEGVEAALSEAVAGRELEAMEEWGLVLGAGRLAMRRRALGSEPSRFLLSRLGRAAYSENAAAVESEFSPGPEAYMRRAALEGLIRSRAADATILASARLSPDPEVRRLAAAGTPRLQPAARDDILDPLLVDPSTAVRYEALRAYAAAGPNSALGCAPLARGLDDESVHVRVLAASAPGLAGGCVGAADGPTEETWIRLAGTLSDPEGADVHWQVAAAALGALARVRPGAAAPSLADAAVHPLWQVRMEAAGVAGQLGDEARVRELAADPDHNVREAALRALAPLAGHGADDLYIEALDSRDPQLVMTASALLEGTGEPGVALPALFESLEWFTRFGGETSRDARLALLERIGELVPRDAAAAGAAEGIEPLLEDVDPVVAEAAAELLHGWTGEAVVAHPRPRPRGGSVPSPGTLARYAESRVAVEMADGGRFVIALRPFMAPTNTHRLVTQALGGIVDGLTLHRVVPNFVIQGLSPGANEYRGHGGFTRDEVGLASNLRGTVGLSTRGRDSGDGQIYVNLVDNPRLDHTYTVLGRIVEGMDVVDGLTPGAVVATVTVEGPAAN
jgi:cyclophilin family peptidyl-prolyl cis-trans isomerase/HEAT repeat protein